MTMATKVKDIIKRIARLGNPKLLEAYLEKNRDLGVPDWHTSPSTEIPNIRILIHDPVIRATTRIMMVQKSKQICPDKRMSEAFPAEKI